MRLILLFVMATAPLALAARLNPRPRQSENTITVNLGQTYQKIDGFGFSEAYGRAAALYNLSPTDRAAVLDLLFSTTSGAGFSILRNRIGTNIEPTSPGSPEAAPQYVWDGYDDRQLWLSQQAVAYGVKYIYANAWSAPGYMKTNGDESNGGYICGVTGATCSSGDWRQAYADFLVQYIKFYQESGVTITHLGFLNEPDLNLAYPSMLSNGQQAADFIQVLSPTLANSGLSHISITCCDTAGWSYQAEMLPGLAAVDSLLSVVTAHPYSNGMDTIFNTPHPVWQTESANLFDPWTVDWYNTGDQTEGLTWAMKIHDALVKYNCSAYLYWVATQVYNQNGEVSEKLISINADNSYTVSKRLWAFAQWSRFLRPDAVRVGTTSSIDNLADSAYRNADGSVVVQLINNEFYAIDVTLIGVATTGGTVGSWVTDNTRDVEALPVTRDADGTVRGSVPPKAMVSFVIY